jgi:inhibitor of KinA
MEKTHPYEIFPLGDSALTIDLGNRISSQLNQKVLGMQHWFANHPFEGMKDLVLGYSSLSVLYDPFLVQKKNKFSGTASAFIREKLEEAYLKSADVAGENGEEINLPVCYDGGFGCDLAQIAESKNLTVGEIIDIHLSRVYRVYMMGFLPGFAYMGEVDRRIQVSRKQKPVGVAAGSVGIANGQTGIYPLDSPGGWQIIGRTPIKLFEANADLPVKLKAGQSIRFRRITLSEFEQIIAAQTK